MSVTKPKIFVFANVGPNYQRGDVYGVALTEDGAVVANHISSSEDWLKHDLGVSSQWHHDEYREYYPDGFQAVFISIDEQRAQSNADFEAALRRNREL